MLISLKNLSTNPVGVRHALTHSEGEIWKKGVDGWEYYLGSRQHGPTPSSGFEQFYEKGHCKHCTRCADHHAKTSQQKFHANTCSRYSCEEQSEEERARFAWTKG